jgi:hypothetical protein
MVMTITNDLAVLAGGAGGGMSFRNRIINGDMRIAQRGTSFSPTGTSFGSYYLLDRFFIESINTTAVSTWAQSSDAPPGFTNSIIQTVTATQSSVASTGQYYGFCQTIEGYNVADFAYGTSSAKTVTLSFWVKSSVTGTFSASISQLNGSTFRAYPVTYTISSANTWTFISIVITGDTTANSMPTNNTGAWRVEFYSLLSAGYANGTPNIWNSNSALNSFASTTGVNLFATSGATWQITGIQVEVGSAPTTFEHRHITQELALCQRYFEKSYDQGVVPGTASTYGGSNQTSSNGNGYFSVTLVYVVLKRTAATVTFYNPNSGASSSVRDTSNNTDQTNASVTNSGAAACTLQSGALSANHFFAFHWTASAEL